MKKREGYKKVIFEPAKSRIKKGKCPSCGKSKSKWKRRTDWRCCSVECTEKFQDNYIVYFWRDIRMKAFKRDNFACVECGEKPKQKTYEGKIIEDPSKLIADHIKPIALGGKEFNLKNIQTLCKKHNKIKTAKDAKKIAKQRRKEKKLK